MMFQRPSELLLRALRSDVDQRRAGATKLLLSGASEVPPGAFESAPRSLRDSRTTRIVSVGWMWNDGMGSGSPIAVVSKMPPRSSLEAVLMKRPHMQGPYRVGVGSTTGAN